MKPRGVALSTDLRYLLARAGNGQVRLGEILDAFPQRGHVLMIVLFSFPLSLPITLPFIGTPFGLVLTFLGLYLVLGRKPWVPAFLRNKVIAREKLTNIVERLIRVTKFLEHILQPRLPVLTENLWLMRVHATYILVMALLVAMPVPVPIPFSNTVVALPIFVMGLGLLERDGYFIILGYLSSAFAVIYYGGLVWLGQEGVTRMLIHLPT